MRYHPRESLKSRGDVGEVVLESVEFFFFFFFSCFCIFPSLEVNSGDGTWGNLGWNEGISLRDDRSVIRAKVRR